MQKALFGASFLVAHAILFSPALAADEVKDVAESHDVPEIVEEAIAVSEASMLLTESSRAADLLDQASRIVLAGPGDRDTAATRREYASQLAEMADIIRKDTRNITSSEAEYDLAISAYEKDHAETVEKLEAMQASLSAFAAALGQIEHTDALKGAAPLVSDAQEALNIALVEGALWREAKVEIEFSEGDLTEEVMGELNARLGEMNEANDMRLEVEVKPDPSEVLHLNGRVLAKSDLSDVRSAIDFLFSEIAVEEDTEDDVEPVAMPEPEFIAIMLD